MSNVHRRNFLGASMGGMAAALSAGPALLAEERPGRAAGDPAYPDTLFLTWQRDPCTTMTVQWIAKSEGDAPPVRVAVLKKDEWQTVTPVVKPYPQTELSVFRAELAGLTPGTEYQFKIGDRPAKRFRTMPAKATNAFHFISGGDVGVDRHAVANNILAAKQDPYFALIGGDLGYDNGVSAETSLKFIRNYSQHMTDGVGRLIPMVVIIGNHEVKGGYGQPRESGTFFFPLFDGMYKEKTFATLDFGDYLSFVLLDTGHVAPIGGEQADFLNNALKERVDRPHLIVVNHVPAYPSYRPFTGADNDEAGGTGHANRQHWVPLFEKYQVDLVLEHHDHTFKRTHPLKNGLADPNGILYLGDGSWGKLRVPKTPEQRPYLAAVSESYHMTLHRLEGERRFHLALEETGKIIDITMTTKKPRMKPVG